MRNDRLRYDRMVERALRSVVRDALTEAAEHGLPGEHHFYVTFATDHPGVSIPDYLKSQYPQEMTIVIQYQFYALTVDREQFSVTLSFNNSRERLVVPFAAVTTFADPAVNFALQFQAAPLDDDELGTELADELERIGPDADTDAGAGAGEASDGAGATATTDDRDKVVTLDQFRKKQERPSG